MNIPLLKMSGMALLAVVPVLSGCASDPAWPSAGFLQQIESARGRAAHENLMTHYANKAAAARSNADLHRKMAGNYQASVAGGRGMPSMPAHCRGLIASFEGLAVEYEGAMIAHRQLAEQARGS